MWRVSSGVRLKSVLATAVAIASLPGCTAKSEYILPASALEQVRPSGMGSFFLVPANNVIEPVLFEGWFVSSHFIRRLAAIYDRGWT